MSLEVHIEKKLNGFTLRSDFTAGNTATAILGASGCGKSMTLRCIAGIVKPDKGRIVLDGRCCSTASSTSTCRPSSGAWACSSRTTPSSRI